VSRSTRSKVILGAATALALVTAGWLNASAALAEDAPPPSDAPTSEPTPTDEPSPPVDPPVDPPAEPKQKPPQHTITGPDIAAADPTAGNSFSNPIKLSGPWNLVSLDNSSATVQSHEPRSLVGGGYVTRTQWIKFKATRTGTIAINAFAGSTTDDLGLNVYTGSSLTSLTRKASDDDAYWPVDGAGVVSGPPSREAAILGLDVVKDKSYYIQVGSQSGSSSGVGTAFTDISVFIYGVDFHPSNDTFNHAQQLTLGSDTYTKANAYLPGSSMDVWEPYDNDINPSRVRLGSVWFKWKAPQDGHAWFGACGFFDQSALGLFNRYYSGGGYGELASIGFDEGTNCGFASGGFVDNVPVDKGEYYWLQVSKVAGAFGQTPVVSIDATFDAPYIEKLSKTSGHPGTTVILTGQSFNSGGAPVVKFGSKTASIVTYTATSITVKAPSHSLGKVDVTVTSGADVSNKRSFTYVP